MKYNLANPVEVIAARSRVTYLVHKKQVVNIVAVNPKRTLNQNSYLHLLLGAYGLELGYTLEEAKTVYKRDINPEIYVYAKNGSKFLRSSADLDVAAMTRSIDHLREFAKEQGIDLPAAENVEELRSIENAMEKSNYYLRSN